MPAQPADRHDPYACLRIPAMRRFIFGNLFVFIGTAAQGLAIAWEVYERTNSAMALGLVGLAQAVPLFLFTLPAGYLADVFDRRKLMVAGMLGTTLTSLALAALSYTQGSILLMFALLFLDASFIRLSSPARTALVPLLVPPHMLENAIKWRTMLFHIAAVVGPAVGGLIINYSTTAAYLFSAGTTTVFIVMLLNMHVPDAPRSQRGQMLRQVAEGIRFVWHRKIILGAVSLDMFAVLFGGAVFLLPMFARDILTNPPFGMNAEQMLGWLRAAPAAGSLTMALLLTHLPPMKRAGHMLFGAVAAFGLATIVFGFSRCFLLSWCMLFLTGFFDNISVVVRHTLVQLRTPNEMRGRVSAVNSIFIGSSNQLGGFESGLVAQFFGPIVSVVSGGIGTLLIVAGWVRLFPGLRTFGTLSGEEPQDEVATTTG